MASDTNKIIMLDFYTPWWGACSRLDTDTFSDKRVIAFSQANFINLKINTDTDAGFELFKDFHGISLPTLLFINPKGNEIDRLIGYYDSDTYLSKINDIVQGINTLDYFLTLYNQYPDSLALSLQIGNKYLERNLTEKATPFFNQVLASTNKKYYQEAEYRLAYLEYENNNFESLLNFIDKNQNSDFTYTGIRTMIRYYRGIADTIEEVAYYKKLINFFPTDPNALNSYGWRMSELEMNLADALAKTKLAVQLSNEDLESKANILDTEAEILWKLGRVDEAIQTIEKAISINPTREYFSDQKNKFLKSL